MSYKDSKALLQKEGLIKECPIDYDFMRKKRHRFIYEPDIPCSMKEAKDAIKTAEEFVHKVSKLIREKIPQREFDFRNQP